MAFSASNFGVTVSYMDGGANVVTREYIMDDDIATYEDAETAATEIVTDLTAATDAAIPEYRVFQIKREGSLVIPAATVQVENCASMTLLLSTPGNKKANLNIPAPKIGLFVGTTGPQSNIVNMGVALVTDVTDNFLPAGKFTISDGETISRGLSGKRVHKKSNKG